LVFAGILVTVLAAIEVAKRFSFKSPGRLYVALAAGLTLAWVVSPELLLSLSVVPRFLAATVVAFTPVFVANLIFAERFRGVGSSVVAFGANLLGAMVGGLLEYGALVVGYRALLLVVASLYSLAFVFRPRDATPLPTAEVATEQRHMELTAPSSQISLTETMRRRKLPKL
jgi:MFS family permease